MRFTRAALLLAVLFNLQPVSGQQGNQLSFDDLSASPGEERTLYLNAAFTDEVTGLVVTILYDPSVIQILDLGSAALAQGFSLQSTMTAGRITMAMAGAEAVTALYPEPLVELTVRVIGVPGAVTPLTIASAVLDEGDHSALRTHGSLTVVRTASITGWVLYYANLRPVPAVVLTASGPVGTVEDSTGSEGRYQLGPMEVGDYDVSLGRSAADLSAIDAVDASDILRALVGMIQLSGDQQRVADVSGNEVIGTTDAALILRLLVGLETSFPAGDFWQFQPADLRFRPLLQDEFRNFTAALLGDVNGDWGSAGSSKRLAAGIPRLGLDSVPGGRGAGTGAVMVRTKNVQSLRAGVIEVRYDPAVLRATGVRRAHLGADYLVASNLAEPGIVRVAFAGVEGLDGPLDLLRVNFDEVGMAGTTTVIDLRQAQINGQFLPPPSLARIEYRLGRPTADFDGDGMVGLDDFFILLDNVGSTDSRYDLDGSGQVEFGDLFVLIDQLSPVPRRKAIEAAAGFVLPGRALLEPNHPNPFNSTTVIPFFLAEEGTASVVVYDLAGQQVAGLVDGPLTSGRHQVTWNGRNDAGQEVASGSYFVRLISGNQLDQRKLLLLR